MANSDKDIKITPNTGESASPKIEVTGADNATKTITINDDGTISFDSTIAATSGSVANGNANLVTGDAVFDYIAAQGFTTNTGDITGVDLTGGTGVTIGSETNTQSGAYSSTISIGQAVGTSDDVTFSTLTLASDLIHSGDTNNKIAFGTDTQSFQTGGTARFNISDSGLQIGSGARVTTINTGFSDNDTSLMTSAAINDRIESFGYITSQMTFVLEDDDGTEVSISNAEEIKFHSGNTSIDINYSDISPGSDADPFDLDFRTLFAPYLRTSDDRDFAPEDLDNTIRELSGRFSTKTGLEDGSTTNASDYVDALVLDTFTGHSGGDANLLAFSKNSTKRIYHYRADQDDTNWGTASTIAYTSDIADLTVSDLAAAAVVTESEGIGSNDNDTTLPTSAAVKDYVDNNAGGSPGGSNHQIQFNNGGSFGGDANFTFDDTANAEKVVLEANSSETLLRITQEGEGHALVVEDAANPDSTPFVINKFGRIGIGENAVNNSYALSTDASGNIRFGTNGFITGGRFLGSQNKTASEPMISRLTDTNTGIFFPGADQLGFSTGGTERLRFGDSGQIGIAGANYGTSGQVLTSGGASGAVSWTTVSSGGASVIGGLTDVSMDITNFVDGFLLQTNSDGSAPTTGTLNSATGNIGIGKDVLKTITSADHNVAIGTQAGDSITTGGRNIMIGEFAGEAIDTATDNVIIGARAGRAIHDRSGAIMIGRGAGENAQSSGVIFIGENAGAEATNDGLGYVIAIGHDAGEYGANANYGVIIGKSAGKGNSTDTAAPNFMTTVGHFAMENITTGDDNSAFGYQAMRGVTTGSDNIAVGSEALHDVTTGDRNIAIGYRAADGFDTESDNIAIGFGTLGGSIAGAEYNVFIGNNAGDSHTSGDNNVAVGHDAFTGGSGMQNVCIGASAGKVMTNNNQQTLVGYEAGKAFSGTNAKLNTAIGYQAMGGGTISPHQNTALGAGALFNVNGVSRNNIGIGYQAGVNQTAGSGNVIIGAGVDVSSTSGDRQLIIAGNDGSTTTTWITGTSAGHVSLGNFTFDADQTVGSGQDNYVLTYDNSSGTIGLEEASGGSASPAGSDGQIQYNNGGSFGGDADLVFDDSNNRLILGSLATQHDFEQKFVIRGTDAGMLIEKHDNSASGGPGIHLYRYSASVADGDLIGQVNFRGEGSTGNPSTYISIRTEIEDTTEGTKDGSFIVRGLINNSQTDMAEIHAAGLTLNQGTFNGNMGTDTYKPAVFMDSGNINVTTTEVTIPFDTEVLDPAGNASLATGLGEDGHIRLVAGGYYRISYSIPINDDGSTGPDRTRVFVDMQTSSSSAFSSSTTVAQSRCQVYTRESSGGSGLSTSFIYEHTANDYIRLRVDAQNATDISTETNECQISIEYLGPA